MAANVGDVDMNSLKYIEESIEHNKEFSPPDIIKVCDNVFVAIGYCIANTIILEGEESLVIVDSGDARSFAQQIRRDFEQKTSIHKPAVAVIYTHHHGDHCHGTMAWIDDSDCPPQIWAHETYNSERTKMWKSSARIWLGCVWQFGYHIENANNYGIGPVVNGMKEEHDYCLPTHFAKGNQTTVKIAGMELTLIHTPGETDDQIAVWWPERKVLLPGDNIYKCYPNIYAIRGVPGRNPEVWAKSLELLAELDIEFLVPSHTRPVSGSEEVHRLLLSYADGIQSIYDQTIGFINQGLHPNEICKKVQLPPSLVAHPYLKEFYGKIDWHIKSIYAQNFGWFTGTNVTELSPIVPTERSEKYIEMVGASKLRADAKSAFERGDLWWAVELSNHLVNVSPDDPAKIILQKSLKSLAETEISSNAQLTYATFGSDAFNCAKSAAKWQRSFLKSTSAPSLLFPFLSCMVKPTNSDAFHHVLYFSFADLNKTWKVYFRHSVFKYEETTTENEKCDFHALLNLQGLIDLLLREHSLNEHLKSEVVSVKSGDVSVFRLFLECFETCI